MKIKVYLFVVSILTLTGSLTYGGLNSSKNMETPHGDSIEKSMEFPGHEFPAAVIFDLSSDSEDSNSLRMSLSSDWIKIDGRWDAIVSKIEALFQKYGGDFIKLPSSIALDGATQHSISPIGVSQEFYVEVMGSNPSHFRDPKYCPGEPGTPGAYKQIQVKGKTVEMCPDHPVETVTFKKDRRSVSEKDLNSVEDFIERLNHIYENAGRKTRFRFQTPEEYFYADSQGGARPKLERHAQLSVGHEDYLGNFMPFQKISNRSPSGERQTRSFWENAANPLGFRRSGVWESTLGLVPSLPYEIPAYKGVGGNWEAPSTSAISGFFLPIPETFVTSNFGPSRLVRME